ncbi:MAG: tetratricopeptide repeat protein, partial [Wenzhouxiangella sp.]
LVGVALAVLLPALVIVALIVHGERLEAERGKAEHEAALAREVTDYMVDLFKGADPNWSPGQVLTAQDLIAQGVDRIGQLDHQPLVQITLLHALSTVLQNIGEYEDALRLSEQALEKTLMLPDATPNQLAEAWLSMAIRLDYLNRYQEASEAYLQALRHAPAGDSLRIRTLANLGITLTNLSQHARAEAVFREGIEEARQLDEGFERMDLLYNSLGRLLWQMGRIDEALGHFQQALALRLADPDIGPGHPSTTSAQGNIAAAYMALGDLDQAYTGYREALAARRQALGPSHPDVARLLHMIGTVSWRRGDTDNAEAYWKEALEIRLNAYGPEHATVAASRMAMARVAQHQGELDLAEALLEQALKAKQSVYGYESRNVADVLFNQGVLYRQQNRYPESRHAFEQALLLRQSVLGPDHPRVAETLKEIGSMTAANESEIKSEDRGLSAIPN